MTKEEIKKLDELYQVVILSKYDNNSIISGEATLVHHFKHKSQGFSLRWYIPNGVPLGAEQHNIIHSSDERGREFEAYIINIKGGEWLKDLTSQGNKIVKYLKYEEVLKHISGIEPNYC